MPLRKPCPISDKHILDRFTSGNPLLDDWLRDRAAYNQEQGFSRTFVVADEDYNVVGYHSLCAGLLKNALMSVISSAQLVAFRAVVVHAIDDEAVSFYRKYHFRATKGMERRLILPTRDIVASIAAVTG